MRWFLLLLCLWALPAQAAQYIYSNNGLSWRGEQDSYSPKAGEVAFGSLATAEQLTNAFPGYAAATVAANAPATLAGKIASGIAVTSTGTAALSATYALDSMTLDQIGSVARDAAAGLGLPGGLSTFTYPDINGSPHTFASADVQNIYKAMRNLLFALNTQAAVMAAGGSPSWPVQTATIP